MRLMRPVSIPYISMMNHYKAESNKQPVEVKMPVLNSPAEIKSRTQEKLSQKISQIEQEVEKIQKKLEKLGPQHSNAKGLLVCCEDFFEGSSIAINACMDPEITYSVIGNQLRDLSTKHPNIIICPGSVYLSTPAPTELGKLQFTQDNTKYRLEQKHGFAANIMPVLYGGQVVAIIRKGEKLVAKTGKKCEEVNFVDDITKESLLEKQYLVPTYKEGELLEQAGGGKQDGACYMGKTLMPGEIDLIKKHILKNENADNKAVFDLFNHDHVIDGKKFMFVICGEFHVDKGHSTTKDLLEKNEFDYIIHSTEGGPIGKNLRKGATYIHSDYGNNNEFIPSALQEKRKEKAVLQKNNTIFRYSLKNGEGVSAAI